MNNHIPADLVPLGKIIKPHGIRGEVKVRLYNCDSETLKMGQSVWVESEGNDPIIYVIEKLNLQSDKSRLKFKNVNDRNSAELLRDFTLSVCRDEFPETVDEEFYLVDLIGFNVIDQAGKKVGKVSDIMENPANDILMILDGDKEHLIPMVDDFMTLFDFEKKQVTINLIDGLIDNS
ncbi:MAG: 16S rRNA processing protein RimM [Candidatus Marinimicrobia bacterium]|nr:16S rRNA processing protein RimM [Candidatus Neomarinimicrobiota bacterium]